MALLFKKLGVGDIQFDSVRFSSQTSDFTLSSVEFPEDELKCEFCFEKNNNYSFLRDSHFIIKLFNNPDFAANDIYQIFDNATENEGNHGRLGYLIPLQSLINSQHDYGENEHFSLYAYHCIRKLLKGDDGIPYKKIEIVPNRRIDLESLYGENTHVLILYKPYIRIWENFHNHKFRLDSFLPCLWSFGYLQILESNFNKLYKGENQPIHSSRPEGGRLHFVSTSSELHKDPYILNLFTSFLYFQEHELVRFHLLYQVIELLIEKVFQVDLSSIISDFNNNSDDFYDIRERLSKTANEKSRIDKLFNSFCGIPINYLNDLRHSCNDFLTSVKPEYVQDTPTKALYKTRSLVFHSLRALPVNYETNLKNVNLQLERLLIKAIQDFSIT
ncbi:hypothetical protein GM418_27365 [Maribellus comscasis]|uniref:Uncharacterized protein n=1 Tax=Maribellus comscasis TaxID=2681766 RepID=A0A6I6K1D1_9BACT|nr:hypothetical protein [Maribellus comscasis]QGY47248.1 hypothetical protein GM418_27365 [Maribellus comscasis]